MRRMYGIWHEWTLDTFKPDIALSRDESSRFLPWIIALMVYLAALTLAGGFTLHRTVTASQSEQIHSFSVHIPYSEHAASDAQKALGLLKNTNSVADAALVSTDRIRQLVEPWLGHASSLENLPLPTVIEGKLTPDAVIDYAGLRARLRSVAPGADIDDHKQWLEQFSAFIRMVQWILFVIAVFIIGATAAVVIFACKTSLKIHRGTVNLLHRLGAKDGYIASQFQSHAAFLALKGAFVGSGFAAGTLLALHLMARHLDSPLFPSFALTLEHWGILLALPVAMSALALLAARISVLSSLGRMP